MVRENKMIGIEENILTKVLEELEKDGGKLSTLINQLLKEWISKKKAMGKVLDKYEEEWKNR